MSDPAQTLPSVTGAQEDRLMPAAAYGLYFVGLFTALPVLLGVILAYVVRGQAGVAMRTHYDFLIRTFWGAVWFWVIGGLMIIVGAPLSLVLIGLPIFFLGWGLLALAHLWVLLRLVVGSVYLLRGEGYPRPQAWLI